VVQNGFIEGQDVTHGEDYGMTAFLKGIR